MVGLSYLEAVVRRVAAHPDADLLVLRGGLLSRRWVLPYDRPVDDVDLLAEPPLDQARVRHMLIALPTLAIEDGATLCLVGEPEVIWAETAHPGLRAVYHVEHGGVAHNVQLDVGFGDPLDPPAVRMTLPTTHPPAPTLRVIQRETGIAWKLHGLFEHTTTRWRPKDLHDLDLFLMEPCDDEQLRRAIQLAFSSKETPLSVTDRLWEGELGRSGKSKAGWEELATQRPALPPMEEVIARVSARLWPVVESCYAPIRAELFPVLHHWDEVWPVVSGLPRFVAHRRDGFTVLNAEGYSEWPDPQAAKLPRTRWHRALLRECRGLVFDADGALIARPYHKFFLIGDRPEAMPGVLAARVAEERPHVLEKLDGATILAGRLNGALRLFSRRGLPPLASAAQDFLATQPALRRRLNDWIEQGYTPLLEWCARGHRLVVDYPTPRLALTGLRRRDTGAYLPYEAMCAEAEGLDVVASRGRTHDLAGLVGQVRAEPEGEGVVLRFDDGHMAKLKTNRYLRLHRAVESPAPERAMWEVILEGEADLLAPLLSAAAAARFAALVEQVEAALAREIAWVEAALAEGLHPRDLTGPRQICLRLAQRGEAADTAVRTLARSMARGAQARVVRGWLT